MCKQYQIFLDNFTNQNCDLAWPTDSVFGLPRLVAQLLRSLGDFSWGKAYSAAAIVEWKPSLFGVVSNETSREVSFRMQKVKLAADHEGKTVKDFLIELAEARIQELKRKGILPKGRWGEPKKLSFD